MRIFLISVSFNNFHEFGRDVSVYVTSICLKPFLNKSIKKKEKKSCMIQCIGMKTKSRGNCNKRQCGISRVDVLDVRILVLFF